MTYADESPENQKRQRAWHRNRAITRKALREPSRLAVDRMGMPALWASLHARLYALEDRISDGADVQMARDIIDARAIVRELELRGIQLEFVLPD